MRLLLDECVTRCVKRDLSGFDVHTIEQAGFKGLKNGLYCVRLRESMTF
jgi:hypothetical protein